MMSAPRRAAPPPPSRPGIQLCSFDILTLDFLIVVIFFSGQVQVVRALYRYEAQQVEMESVRRVFQQEIDCTNGFSLGKFTFSCER